jgi:hypothetical protein
LCRSRIRVPHVASDQRDIGAFTRQSARNSLADAAAPSRNNGNLSL